MTGHIRATASVPPGWRCAVVENGMVEAFPLIALVLIGDYLFWPVFVADGEPCMPTDPAWKLIAPDDALHAADRQALLEEAQGDDQAAGTEETDE